MPGGVVKDRKTISVNPIQASIDKGYVFAS